MSRVKGHPDFKVIIVGGSISGLILAHCLKQANIDHVVLEKRKEIAPQEGASIGIWPNGGRVLDQLGLQDELESATEALEVMHIAHPDGCFYSNGLFTKISQRFGYPVYFMDRQKFLEILYKRFPDKSNILVNKKVVRVESFDNGACVITKDGTSYHGSLVIGADGVHSMVRSEMWRLADLRQPGRITDHEKQSMTVEYSCIFGISSPISGISKGEHVNAYMDGLTVLVFHGKGGRIYWFVVKKLDRIFHYPDTPRFSASDAEGLCSRLGNVRIWKDICIRHLWDSREVASMAALEEGFFKTWHHDRILLMGDSVHKMTPNIGQGANTAIEDAAMLTSLLESWPKLRTDQSPCAKSINRLLETFQEKRYKRIRKIHERSRFATRMHTRDGVVKILLGRYIIPYLKDRLADMTSEVIADGDIVSFLPYPGRSGSGWVDYSSAAKHSKPSIGGLGYTLTILVAIFGIAIWTRGVFLWN